MSSVPLRTRIIPWYFVMFFVVIAAVNAVMVTLAVRTHSGVVTDHPYEKGLAYNKVIAAEEAQEKLGWKGTLTLKGDRIEFSLKSKNGNEITPPQATAYFTRPTSQGHDFSALLKQGKAVVTFPESGVWDVRVKARVDEIEYQQTARIVAP